MQNRTLGRIDTELKDTMQHGLDVLTPYDSWVDPCVPLSQVPLVLRD